MAWNGNGRWNARRIRRPDAIDRRCGVAINFRRPATIGFVTCFLFVAGISPGWAKSVSGQATETPSATLCCAMPSSSLIAFAPPQADRAFRVAINEDDKSLLPTGFLSWIKLLLVTVTFLIWVFLSDRLNQDAIRFGNVLNMAPENWNLANVLCFLVAFLLVLLVPIFWVGFPIFALAAVATPLAWFLVRRSRIKSNASVASQIKTGKIAIKGGDVASANVQIHGEPLPQDEGADVTFKPKMADKKEEQVALIRARQSPSFHVLKNVVADALEKRAEVVMLDYTREMVRIQMQVDGTWHQIPSLDRESGDSMLAAAKSLAGANPRERRASQQGLFAFRYQDFRGDVELKSQGVQTGERVQLKFIQKQGLDTSLPQLGMWPDMHRRLTMHLNEPGLVIISAPPKKGLSTTWKATIRAADRVTRDCVAFVRTGDREHNFENVTRFDFPSNGAPIDIMKTAMMTQPESLVVPAVVNSETLDELTRLVDEEQKSVLTHIQAGSATEALLKLYSMAGDRRRFVESVTAVTCQGLARRLCETCRQEIQVKPELIQQLGGDPSQQRSLFNHFTGPRPDQVDRKGNPIEIPPCKVCKAFGYIGRIAYFEMIEPNEKLRQVIYQQPNIKTVASAAKKLGFQNLTQQAYRLALVGLTSPSEIQRSLKS